MQAPNPKKAFGDKKPSLHLVPLSGMLAQWEAQYDGCLKYTEVNWRKDPIEAMTYIDAILRHARLYENGEAYARDTKVKNLGAVMACCAILIDAELHGTLIDNRTHSPQTCDLLHGRGEEMVQVLRAAQAERERAKADLALIEKADAAKEEPCETCGSLGMERYCGREDCGKRWRADKFEYLKADAIARAKGENLDGSPRRETTVLPLSQTWRSCRDCETWSCCGKEKSCKRGL